MNKISRRNFISTAALAASSVTTGCCSANAGAKSEVKPLKFCMFADIHYAPGVFTNTEDMSFLEKIQERAVRENCDMIIHLGDLVHGVRTKKE
ncbi:MAG: metallophosphoesterase, partial [Kiritimatiellae bacterium]|nr:metallophosphoesterase [Kiritimatiellia bacterium]